MSGSELWKQTTTFPSRKKLLGVVQTDCDGFSDAKKKVITIGVVVHTFFLLQVFISLEK